MTTGPSDFRLRSARNRSLAKDAFLRSLEEGGEPLNEWEQKLVDSMTEEEKAECRDQPETSTPEVQEEAPAAKAEVKAETKAEDNPPDPEEDKPEPEAKADPEPVAKEEEKSESKDEDKDEDKEEDKEEPKSSGRRSRSKKS